MEASFEALALIVFTATALAFIARKTRQPNVIAYIATGLLLGNVGLGVVEQTEMTQIFSELGLVFLLFFIGLEIELERIKEIIRPITIIGVLQMILTFLFGFSLGALIGFSLVESIFLGAASMFSSTALVVKMLTDKDESSTLPGRLDVGILLIQDVAVVLILAILTANFSSPTAFLIRFGEILLLVAIAGITALASSKYILPEIFRRISENKHAFFVYGLGWAFLFITGAEFFNLSLEIGAFFAGLSLAQLPYSDELQERVRPLTDLFMAVFFINFGLSIFPGQLSAYLSEAIIFSVFLMAAKAVIIFSLVDRLNFTPETSFKSSINMTQISEFSLIMGSLAVAEGFISQSFLGFLSMVAIITMGSSSYLLIFNSEIYQRVSEYLEEYSFGEGKEHDIEVLENHALVIGYNETVERLVPDLEQIFETLVIVDYSQENIQKLSSESFEYIYGDFNHGEIRNAASVNGADFILSVAGDMKVNHHILRDRKRESTVFLEAGSFEDAAELYEEGAEYVIVENLVTAEKVSDYLELFLEDRELFHEQIEKDIEKIHWGGRDG